MRIDPKYSAWFCNINQQNFGNINAKDTNGLNQNLIKTCTFYEHRLRLKFLYLNF